MAWVICIWFRAWSKVKRNVFDAAMVEAADAEVMLSTRCSEKKNLSEQFDRKRQAASGAGRAGNVFLLYEQS